MVLRDRSIISIAKDDDDDVDEDKDEELKTQDMKRVHHRITDINRHRNKWGVRCCLVKEDGTEILKDAANSFDFLK